MDFNVFSDPVVLSLLGKIAAGAVVFLLLVGFIPGVIIGWFVGKASWAGGSGSPGRISRPAAGAP